MSDTARIVRSVLASAIAELEERRFPLYTFAFYRDHESGAVSVCADTRATSERSVLSANKYNWKHFLRAVESGDLKSAERWQCNIGRSLSLGDFELVNLGRSDLPSSFDEAELYLQMVHGLIEVQERVLNLAPAREQVVFACSGPLDEVQLVWSPAGET